MARKRKDLIKIAYGHEVHIGAIWRFIIGCFGKFWIKMLNFVKFRKNSNMSPFDSRLKSDQVKGRLRNLPRFSFLAKNVVIAAGSLQNLHWKLGCHFNSFGWFRQLLFSCFSMGCLIELKLCEFHQILLQPDSVSFSFLSWKTKKFYS